MLMYSPAEPVYEHFFLIKPVGGFLLLYFGAFEKDQENKCDQMPLFRFYFRIVRLTVKQ